jgi:hypothetical protein
MSKTRRVAVVIDLSVPLRHHHEVFTGIQRYARQHAEWECVAEPFIRTLGKGRGKTGYRGIIARATAELAQQAAKAGVPLVNVWSGSPAKTLPSVLANFEACGRMAAEHLLQRGFRQFAFQGLPRHRGTSLALAGFKAVLRAAKCRCTTQIVSPTATNKPSPGRDIWCDWSGGLADGSRRWAFSRCKTSSAAIWPMPACTRACASPKTWR